MSGVRWSSINLFAWSCIIDFVLVIPVIVLIVVVSAVVAVVVVVVVVLLVVLVVIAVIYGIKSRSKCKRGGQVVEDDEGKVDGDTGTAVIFVKNICDINCGGNAKRECILPAQSVNMTNFKFQIL